MATSFQINEKLVSKVALLTAGACVVALTGFNSVAVVGYGVFSAPVADVGEWGLARWLNRFRHKNPEARATIQKIQNRLNETLTGNNRFADMDDEARGVIDNHLPQLIAKYWPSPKIIAELAGDLRKLPVAIANHILDEINGANLPEIPDNLFEDGQARDYLNSVVTTAINTALEDEEYFKKIEPKLLLHHLNLTGQIKRDFDGFLSKINEMNFCFGEVLEILNDIRKTQLADSAKIDFIYKQAKSNKAQNEDAYAIEDSQTLQSLKVNAAEMYLSPEKLIQDTVRQLKQNPEDYGAATEKLKDAIRGKTEESHKIKILRFIATINNVRNPSEALSANLDIVRSSPEDATAWNQVGQLARIIGNFELARNAYKEVASLGEKMSDLKLQALGAGNLGIVNEALGELDDALGNYAQALKISKSIGWQENMAVQYGSLALLKAKKTYNCEIDKVRSLNSARKDALRAMKLNEKVGRCIGMAQSHDTLSIIERKLCDFEKAFNHAKIANKIFGDMKEIKGQASACNALGLIRIEQYKVSEDWSKLGEAENFLIEAKLLNEKIDRKPGLVFNYTNLADVAELKGSIGQAKVKWKYAKGLAIEMGMKDAIMYLESKLEKYNDF